MFGLVAYQNSHNVQMAVSSLLQSTTSRCFVNCPPWQRVPPMPELILTIPLRDGGNASGTQQDYFFCNRA